MSDGGLLAHGLERWMRREPYDPSLPQLRLPAYMVLVSTAAVSTTTSPR